MYVFHLFKIIFYQIKLILNTYMFTKKSNIKMKLKKINKNITRQIFFFFFFLKTPPNLVVI